MTARQAPNFCLNGWWDYVPSPQETPPAHGYQERGYLVPSFVTKSLAGVRLRGETFYREHLGEDPARFAASENEFLYDNHHYPNSWLSCREGWARRAFTVPNPAGNTRWHLRLEAVAARSEVWLNGKRIGSHADAFLPQELDVTDALVWGDNTLHVRIRDYERLDGTPSKTLAPSGNMLTGHFRGIWQDVTLFAAGSLRVTSSRIQCSYREATLFIETDLINEGATTCRGRLDRSIAHWSRDACPFAQSALMDIPPLTLTLDPGERRTVSVRVRWPAAPLWEPADPRLLWLRSILHLVDTGTGELTCSDSVAERFGFREVWLEGKDLLLNGHPVHLFSDWGHRLHELHLTEAWNRAWFGMLRRENLNHTRLHTHPHSPLVLDLADELGILVTAETAVHGSGGEQAADEPAYWEAARSHVRAMLTRDFNHPCIILWSVANEMRWNQDRTTLARRELPALRTLFSELDPTRPAYHEGDSSLWDETAQPILSRHYGKECGGLDWWDQQRPLLAGELSTYHYLGPNTNFHIGDDAVWADYTKLVEAAAQETAWIVEAGRTRGVLGFGPWNLSGLLNLRVPETPLTLSYSDWTRSGAKPRNVAPHSSEFAFWEEVGSAPAYKPLGSSAAIQSRSMRPRAALDLSTRQSYYGGRSVERRVHLVNDGSSRVGGQLRVSLSTEDGNRHTSTHSATVERGRCIEVPCALQLPQVTRRTRATYSVAWIGLGGRVLDAWDQHWVLHPEFPEKMPTSGWGRVLLAGGGVSERWLSDMGIPFERIPSFDSPVPAGAHLLILEHDTIIPGTPQNQWVLEHVRAGGRVLVMEQTHSLFPGVRLECRPQLHALPRGYGHPVLAGVGVDSLRFWGEEPYAAIQTDAHVALHVYEKGQRCLLKPLVDAGEGGFGLRLPEWTVLGELRHGDGLLLASQFRFNAKASSIPEARHLFASILNYLQGACPAPSGVLEVEGEDPPALEAACRAAHEGGTAWLRVRQPCHAASVSRLLSRDLLTVDRLHYHAVRAKEDPALCGVSNADTSGVDGMTYCFGERNQPVSNFSIQSGAGIEPLLVAPTTALLEEMHVHGQRVEALRAHAASRFLNVAAETGRAPQRCMLARIRHGRGWIYIDTFLRPDDGHPRLARYESLLRRNLGSCEQACAVAALEGDAVPPAAGPNAGHPTQVCMTALTDSSLLNRLRPFTALPAERMAPSGMLTATAWSLQEEASGLWNAPAGGDYVLYTCFHSPRPRRTVMEDSGIPNPASLTFLDVEGAGACVELLLNGAEVGTRHLDRGHATFADLELAQSFNQLLLVWRGAKQGASLRFRLRDIQGNPERELTFLVCDASASRWLQLEF